MKGTTLPVTLVELLDVVAVVVVERFVIGDTDDDDDRLVSVLFGALGWFVNTNVPAMKRSEGSP